MQQRKCGFSDVGIKWKSRLLLNFVPSSFLNVIRSVVITVLFAHKWLFRVPVCKLFATDSYASISALLRHCTLWISWVSCIASFLSTCTYICCLPLACCDILIFNYARAKFYWSRR
uniref:Cytoplasmic polyadenylation element-binding protein ZZ domain-containing protein n=1 Tax=Parascaris univalens TaxID=6257 RepID=A0A915A147_PARUN